MSSLREVLLHIGPLMRAAHEQGRPEFFNAPTLTKLVRTNDGEGHDAALACLERLKGDG